MKHSIIVKLFFFLVASLIIISALFSYFILIFIYLSHFASGGNFHALSLRLSTGEFGRDVEILVDVVLVWFWLMVFMR